jgi:DNA polymerase-3 subunit gamma/tau
LPIEEALARVSAAAPPPVAQRSTQPAVASAPARQPSIAAPPAPRTGPSPFELDRAKKAAARPLEPQSSGANAQAPAPEAPPSMEMGDPRERLHSYLHEKGQQHLADAVEDSTIQASGAELVIVTAKSYALYFKDAAFEAAVRQVFGKPLRIKVTTGDAAPPAAAIQLAPSAGEEQATSRALAHPEVRRFQEVFGGEIRKVRNLKES